MERGVRVNAGRSTIMPEARFRPHPTGTPVFIPISESEDEFGIETGNMNLVTPLAGDQGPCLYLGPQGQRCGRRALRDGFCSNHLPGSAASINAKSSAPSKKIIAALIAISGLLWPLVADIVREVLRWLHSH